MDEIEIYILVFSIISLVLGYYWSKKQFKLFCKKAENLGMLHSTSVVAIESQLNKYSFMKLGHSQESSHLFRTVEELPKICIFHRKFSEGYADPRWDIVQHFIFVKCKSLCLTKIQMIPKHLLHKTGPIYRSREILFEDDIEFENKFYLSGVNEKVIKEIFTEKLRKLMLKYSDLAFETHNDGFIIFRRNVLIKPSQIQQYISYAQCIFEELNANTVTNP
ncbi:MAG: hypothetical protein OQK09_07740 [Colwellia sp.]|nr:hypothetical protein [Colwellia sp.]MCW9081392.1 hypothetical protein [Colwellia sp.]